MKNLLIVLVLSTCLIALSSDTASAQVRTSIIEIDNSVYVTQVQQDQLGNTYSTTKRYSASAYRAELQRQQYMMWYNSLNPMQRASVNSQQFINNTRLNSMNQMRQLNSLMGF